MVAPAQFTREYITEYVRTKLGHPVVKVELDEPQIYQCIEDTQDLFEEYRPIEYIQAQILAKGSYMVDPPENQFGLLDVDYIISSSSDYDSIEASLLYDPFYFISSGALGGTDVQLYDMTRHWMEMIGRVFSSEFDYEMTDHGLFLYLPSAAKVRLTWAMPYDDLEQVRREYQQLFLKITIAKARQVLGAIRSKFSGVPGAGGMVQLDGEYLRDKGAADEEKYVDELMRISPHFIPSLA